MRILDILFPGLAALDNVHPLFVHFPIAFFFGAVFVEGIAIARDERLHLVTTWMLYLGTFCAILAASTGFIAEYSVAAHDPRGHNSPGHEFVHIHRAWMISVTLFSVLVSAYLFWINVRKRWSSHRWALVTALFVLCMVVSMGADRGARLVYEFGTGVNPAVLKTEEPNGDGHTHTH
jgi:uncharacterized membrane protein